ncbi:MAG TPA: hypothetical protein VKV77_13200 [Methylovirgula sp.]|nr:hypothetical protein [Methylovirgula sp.]
MIVILAVLLAPSVASASSYRHRPVYSHCHCHFGYGDVCTPVASCYAEGGRCTGHCLSSLSHSEESNYPATATSEAPTASADIVKKCGALAAKAYPPRVPGNPAAGSAKGTAKAKQAYFKQCVANGGNDQPKDNGAK